MQFDYEAAYRWGKSLRYPLKMGEPEAGLAVGMNGMPSFVGTLNFVFQL
jgi:hypothetical protein